MSGGAKSSKTTTEVKLPHWLETASRDLVQDAWMTHKPYTPYTGDRVPDLTAEEQSYVAGTPWRKPLEASEGAIGNAATRWIDPGVVDSYMDPYTKNVTDIAIRELERAYGSLAKKRDIDALGAGGYGDMQHGVATAEGERNLLQTIADTMARGLHSGYMSGADIFNRDRAAAAGVAELLRGVAAARTQLAGSTNAYGRNVAQQQADADYEAFVEGRDWDRNWYSWFAQIIGASPGNRMVTETSTTKTGGGTDWLNLAIGGLLGAGSLGSSLLSGGSAAAPLGIPGVGSGLGSGVASVGGGSGIVSSGGLFF